MNKIHLPLLRNRGRFSSRGGKAIFTRRHTIRTLPIAASVAKMHIVFNSGGNTEADGRRREPICIFCFKS